MEHERKRLRQAAVHEAQADAGQLQTGGYRELGTVEEALRADRARVQPPAGLAARVAKAVRRAVGDRWWRRWWPGRGGE